MSQREQTSAQIAEQANFLNTVIESLDHPFLVVNAGDCSLRMANAAARRAGGKEIRTCYDLTHDGCSPCDGESSSCPVAMVKKTGKPVTMEHIYFAPDGRKQHAEIHAFPVFDANKRVSEVIEYSQDITERNEAWEQLREAKEMAERVGESLRETISELEEFNRLAVGRELRMIELKREVNALLAEGGQQPKYEIVEEQVVG